MTANSKSHGFSLVELIVVVAIIALLTSVLVPIFGQARSEAELVKCRATLKSLGLALNLYAQDNSRNYPVSQRCHNPHLSLLQTTTPYVQTPQMFYCPANENPDQTYTPANAAAGNIGYFYFCCQDGPSDLGLSAFLLRSTKWPRYLTETSPVGTWLASDIWYSGAPTAHSWYKKGVNYLTTEQAVGFVPESVRSDFK